MIGRIGKIMGALLLILPSMAPAQWLSEKNSKPVQELMLMTHDELLTEANDACTAFNIFSKVDLSRTDAVMRYFQTIKRVEREHFGTTKGVDEVATGLHFGSGSAETCRAGLEAGREAISPKRKATKRGAPPQTKPH